MKRARAYARKRCALPAGLLVFCGALGWGAPADAEGAGDAIIDREQRFSLTLDQGFRKHATDQDDNTPLLAYEHAGRSAALAVSRVNYPNLAAWRQATREAYFDEIERGVRDYVSEYQRVSRKTSTLDTVPVLDLVFRRGGERGTEVVFMRFLCFRTYTLMLAATLPRRAYKRHRRALERVQRSFKPYLGRD